MFGRFNNCLVKACETSMNLVITDCDSDGLGGSNEIDLPFSSCDSCIEKVAV